MRTISHSSKGFGHDTDATAAAAPARELSDSELDAVVGTGGPTSGGTGSSGSSGGGRVITALGADWPPPPGLR